MYQGVWDGTNELAAVGIMGPRSTTLLESWKGRSSKTAEELQPRPWSTSDRATGDANGSRDGPTEGGLELGNLGDRKKMVERGEDEDVGSKRPWYCGMRFRESVVHVP